MKTPSWYKLKEHLTNHGLIFGDTVANKKYSWFLDSRQALQHGSVLAETGELIWDLIKKHNPEVIYGRGFGAVNLLIATQIAAEKQGHKLLTLLSRDVRKDRNRQRLVEGPRPTVDNLRAVYIDDAMNSGSTYNKTLKALADENIKINTVACAVLFDFWTFTGSRRLELLGIPVERIFTRHDLGITRIDPVEKPVMGEEVWRNMAYNQWYQWYKNPPVIHEDLVYWANDRHEVFAQKLETGEILWQWQGPRPTQDKGIVAEIQVYKDRIYVSSYDGTLYCFNRFTGQMLISHKLDWFLHSTPVISEEKQELYVATEGGIQNKRGDIVALDLMSGTLKWRVPTKDVVPASPYIYKDQVLCGSNDGYLYSVTNGVLNWKIKLGVIKGKINSINSTLIASTENGKLYGLDEHGKILWTRSTGTSTRHQFVQVHDEFKMAYVVTEDGYALAYDEFGNQKWIRRLRGVCAWNMRLHGNEILVITESGYAVILDALTGEKKQMSKTGLHITCPADFNKDYVVVHSVRKGLITYRRELCQD